MSHAAVSENPLLPVHATGASSDTWAALGEQPIKGVLCPQSANVAFAPCDCRHVGLWRVSVLGVEVDARVEPRFRDPGRAPAGASVPVSWPQCCTRQPPFMGHERVVHNKRFGGAYIEMKACLRGNSQA